MVNLLVLPGEQMRSVIYHDSVSHHRDRQNTLFIHSATDESCSKFPYFSSSPIEVRPILAWLLWVVQDRAIVTTAKSHMIYRSTPFSMTMNGPNPHFKVTLVFDVFVV